MGESARLLLRLVAGGQTIYNKGVVCFAGCCFCMASCYVETTQLLPLPGRTALSQRYIIIIIWDLLPFESNNPTFLPIAFQFSPNQYA
eukprot:m.46377 g.46377  ORF g.46377 m.46377 type:complete len:88 (+) comp33694_c0_seq11:2202-2465(+)